MTSSVHLATALFVVYLCVCGVPAGDSDNV